MQENKQKSENKTVGISSGNRWRALAILLIALALTLAASYYTQQEMEGFAKKEYASVCSDINTKITARLHAHAQLLMCGAALFAVSDTVKRFEWKVFIEAAKVEKNLPGIQGIGYSVIIPKTELKSHIQKIRNQGFPAYSVKPEGDRAIYSSIIYLEPFSGRNLRAFGYDMFSEPVRRKAMEYSRDADIATLSGKVVLVQETKEDQQSGTLMYVPVYRNTMPTTTTEERRAAIKGWVYSPLRMRDLMQGILGRWDASHTQKIHLQIFDDSLETSSLLYNSQANDSLKYKEITSRRLLLPVKFNGTKWMLVFTQAADQVPYFQSKTIIVFILGSIISILFFLLALSWYNTKFRAEQIALKLTAELKESEDRLTLAMDQASLVYWEMDAATKTFTFNDKFYKLYKTTADREGGYRMAADVYTREFLLPEEQHIVPDDVALLLSGEINELQQEHSIRRRDGEIRNIIIRINVVRDSAGLIVSTRGSNQDITERRIAENFIISNNQNLSTLNNLADELSSISEAENLYVYLTKKLRQITNALGATFALYNAEKSELKIVSANIDQEIMEHLMNTIQGSSLGEISFPVSEAIKLDLINNPVKTGLSLNVVTCGVVPPTIEIFQQEQRIHYVGIAYIVDGALFGTSVLFLSAAEPNPSLEILKPITNMLAVSLRRCLAEKGTREMLSQLLLSNAEKDKFFSVIAHDLRSPFNSFLGLTHAMATSLKTFSIADIQKFSVSMNKSAVNLFQLLENLLEWAKIKQGLNTFNQENMALLPLVNESLETLLEIATNKGIRISNEIQNETMVFADNRMLQSVLRNLLTNALKFTHKGGNINISAKQIPDNFVEIAVKDNGIGMKTSIKDLLFILNAATNRNGTEGELSSGLGLIISKDFVEKQGGKIWAESEEGVGSTFYFTVKNESEGAKR